MPRTKRPNKTNKQKNALCNIETLCKARDMVINFLKIIPHCCLRLNLKKLMET